MMRSFRYLIGMVVVVASLATAWAGDCRRTAATCVDSTPCKNISGYDVCLANIGISCWKYEDTYECVKPDTHDYCANSRLRGYKLSLPDNGVQRDLPGLQEDLQMW